MKKEKGKVAILHHKQEMYIPKIIMGYTADDMYYLN